MESVARTHVVGLDGLRGVAVLGAVAYHLGHLRGGFVGVDLFFVLSGFLITTLLLARTPSGTAGMRSWWARRFTRLTPAVAVVVIAVLVTFSTTVGVNWDAIATLTWWQNWHLIAEGTSYWASDPSPLRHAWSLSIEEQFYLVWPLLLLGTLAVARRAQRRPEPLVAALAATLALASFLWAAQLSRVTEDLSRIYFGTDTRAGALLIGCAAAAVARMTKFDDPTRPAPPALNAAAVLATIALVGLSLQLSADMVIAYRGGLALAAVASLVLVATVTRSGPFATAMSVAPLAWLGVRSYGLYLWSWPVQLAVEEHLDGLPRYVSSVLIVAVSIVLADVSLRIVETPLRLSTGWARRLVPRRSAWLGGLALVVLGITFATVNEVPPPASAQVTTEESADLALRPPTTPPPTTAPPDGPTPDGPAPDGSTPTTAAPATRSVMVTGDSLAFVAVYNSTPELLAPAGITSIDGRGFIGCGVLSRTGWRSISDTGKVEEWVDECDRQPEAEAIGLTGRPDWVVDFVGGWEGKAFVDTDGVRHDVMSDAIRDRILEELVAGGRRASDAGARTAWVTWVCPGEDSDRNFPDDYPDWINQIMRDASTQVPGSIVIEPTDRVCVGGDAGAAPTEEKNEAWNREHHPEDAEWLWQVWLGPALAAAS